MPATSRRSFARPGLAAAIALLALGLLLCFLPSGVHIEKAQREAQQFVGERIPETSRWLDNAAFGEALVNRKFLHDLPDGATGADWFLYQITDSGNLALRYWTTMADIPDAQQLIGTGTERLVYTGRGYGYLQKRLFSYQGSRYLLVSQIGFYASPNRDNTSQWPLEDREFRVNPAPPGSVVSFEGQPLFYLEAVTTVSPAIGPWAALSLMAGFFLWLLVSYRPFAGSVRRRALVPALMWLLATLGIRAGLFVLCRSLPSIGQQWFDASAFAAAGWLRSAGDAFLYLGLLIWLAGPVLQRLGRLEGWQRWSVFITVYAAGSIGLLAWARAMVIDSIYSFSVTDWLPLSSVPALLVITWLLALTAWLQACFILLAPLRTLQFFRAIPLAGLTAGWLLLFLLTVPGTAMTHFYAAIGFVCLLLSMIYLRLADFRNVYGVVAIAAVSVCLMTLYLLPLQAAHSVKQLVQRSERHLGLYASVVKPLQLPEQIVLPAASGAAGPLSEGSEMNVRQWKDSLLTASFGEVRSLYNVSLYTFDANLQPLFNESRPGFAQLSEWYRWAVPVPAYPGLRYRWLPGGTVRFLYRWKPAGAAYQFLVFGRIPGLGKGVFPALSQSRETMLPPGIGIGYYRLGQLVGQEGELYCPPALTDARQLYQQADNRTALSRSEGIEALVVYSRGSNSDFLAIAALLLPLALLFHFLFWLRNHGSHLLQRAYLSRLGRVARRTTIQLQLLIIGLLLLAFLTVGSFLINRYRQEGRQQQQLRMNTQLQQAATFLQTRLASLFDTPESLQNSLMQARQLSGNELAIYDRNGRLAGATEASLYMRGQRNGQADPLVMRNLQAGNRQTLLIARQNGTRMITDGWVPLQDEKGVVQALLHMPFAEADEQLSYRSRQAQAALLGIFFITGLLAMAGAMVYTRRLQSLYQRIGAAMQRLQAGERNEQLDYPVHDEVGELVRQYNQMVDKLDASVAALRKNERQNAWKTMAQQVAHEIKNPLASMRLNLQFMQKLIEKQVAGLPEKLQEVTVPVIEEIDHLAEIATNFAQYASVGKTEPVHFNVLEPLEQTIQLFGTGRNFRISTAFERREYPVFADEKQLHRVFSNLIKNALEAMDGNAEPAMHISAVEESGFVILRFADEGPGLTAELLEKLFTPHFTTKSTGTGLGLAICRTIAEQWGGSLDAANQPGGGAVFTLRLPLDKTVDSAQAGTSLN